ncbi:MAG TPA: peroxide stress protein YaaA, partial [Thalassospira lucentensis]
GPVITPVFKEVKAGVAKVIGFSAKRARGMMARFMIDNRLETPEGLKKFAVDGYGYQDDLSTETEWVFTRVHD